MISVIMPAYNEGKQIYDNTVIVRSVLLTHKIEHQIILVNDGSTDNTWEEMKRLSDDYKNISIIELSRNFGKEAALCAALENTYSDACVILDSDLQHPPELIPEMVRLWREEGYQVVEGYKITRGKESKLCRIAALAYYKLFHKATGIKLTSASDFKLLDAKVLSAWKSMHESITFFRGMSAWMGFRRIQIPFEVKDRMNGNSNWSLKSLTRLAIQSITSYTSAPLYLISWLGLIMLVFDAILIVETLYMKYIGNAFTGFTTVIILLLGIGSCIMISLGIIGIYISKIYDEVKKRPRYLIAEKQGRAFSHGEQPIKKVSYR